MTTRVGPTVTVSAEAGSYRSHPSIARTRGGDWLIVFSQSGDPDRTFIHPPNDPRFVNVLVRSSDEGRSWSSPLVVPEPTWAGVECSGLTALADGAILLNQFRFDWRPADEARRLWAEGSSRPFIFDSVDERWRPAAEERDWAQHPLAYVRADEGAYVHRSSDGGGTWETARVDIAPYQGAFSPKGGVEVDGEVILALGSHEHDPLAASVLVRSADGGRSWGRPELVAEGPGLDFSEPTIVAAGDSRLLVFSREERSGFLYQSTSNDRGVTWEPPARLPIWGYPAHALRLTDGRLLLVYGHRRPAFGIRGCLSADGGASWEPEFVIRTDVPDARNGLNLGYPSAIEYRPGELFVAYYAENDEGTVGIHGTYVTLA